MTFPKPTAQERIEALGFDYRAQPKRRLDKCPLCANREFVSLARQDRYGFPVRTDGCLTCGLVFINPVMTDEAYAEFYSRTYRDLIAAYGGKPKSLDSVERGQVRYAKLLGDYLEPHVGTGMLLDVGGSTGVVAQAIADRFRLREATVLDPSAEELERAAARGLNTALGTIEERRHPGPVRRDPHVPDARPLYRRPEGSREGP